MSNTKATCKALVKDYCSSCSFAGIHFIADDNKHWSERLLWLALVILSWYGSALLIIAAWDAFVLNPISFGVETTYTDWDTKMPTVAVCESPNNDNIYNVADTIWTPNHSPDLEDVLRDIAFFRGVSYNLVKFCYTKADPDPKCPRSGYSRYAKMIRSGCEQIMANCTYNSKEFSCCEYFQPIETDMGTCFIMNSLQTKKPKPYPMINNLNNSLGTFKFDVMLPVTMYTLGEEEVPSMTTSSTATMRIQLGYIYRRIVAVRNIENDPLITETTPEQRACRFKHESKGELYPLYSYSACTVLCRKRGQIERCQCNDHFMPGTPEDQRCNLSGIACLDSVSSHLVNLKPHWSSRAGVVCNCLPSCDETEITVIKDSETHSKVRGSKKRAKVEVALAYLPAERFKRNVVRSRLDLVVSVGGTTGLFVGASLLSFVELIFFFTVRFMNNLWMNKQNNENIMVHVVDQPRTISQRLKVENIESNDDVVNINNGPYLNSGVIDSKTFYDKVFQAMIK